jgi:N-acetylglucosaminyldiphosphoundecaprenol N-acetyl-beta-D-mannosaminyltransferase
MKIMSVLGIRMNCLSYAEMYPIFDRWLSERFAGSRSRALALINVHSCVSGLLDHRVRDLYNAADLPAIDSMPFLWMARALHQRDSDRFYAPDLLLQVAKEAPERGWTFYLYGGHEGAPERISELLLGKFPELKIVGTYSPPFRQLSPAEDEEICQRINAARPHFLWVGLGSPKQDQWIAEHLDRIHGCILVPSGATFDFFSGRIRQAPNWIRSLGFEWLFRLTQDFQRLWKRYTLYNAVFLAAFAMELIGLIRFNALGEMLVLGKRTSVGNA